MCKPLRMVAIALVMTIIVGSIGCQQSDTTVEGTVTYNGEPVKKGYISFRPTEGSGQSFAAPITDGRYRIAQGTPGKRTVVITGVKEINFYASSAESYKKAAEDRAAGRFQADVAEAADYIAENAEGNSQEVEIKPGNQIIDFSLTGTPRQ